MEKLLSNINQKSKFAIANLKGDSTTGLYCAMEQHIKRTLGLDNGNDALLKSCESMLQGQALDADDVSAFTFLTMCRQLRKTHKLRLMK